jgi:hypothetical protein
MLTAQRRLLGKLSVGGEVMLECAYSSRIQLYWRLGSMMLGQVSH